MNKKRKHGSNCNNDFGLYIDNYFKETTANFLQIFHMYLMEQYPSDAFGIPDNQNTLWFKNGILHDDKGFEWWLNGVQHRISGPAIDYNGYKIWYVNGKLHRLDGHAKHCIMMSNAGICMIHQFIAILLMLLYKKLNSEYNISTIIEFK